MRNLIDRLVIALYHCREQAAHQRAWNRAVAQVRANVPPAPAGWKRGA